MKEKDPTIPGRQASTFEVQLIDSLYLVGGIIGAIGFTSSYFTIEEELSYRLIQLTSLLVIAAFYLFRRHLSIRLKINTVILLVLIIVTNGIINSGPRATVTLLLVLVALSSQMVYSRRVSIIIYLTSIGYYLTVGLLAMQFIPEFQYTLKAYWINHSIFLTLVGMLILVYMTSHVQKMKELLAQVQGKNDELERNRYELEETTKLLEGAIAHSPTGIMIADAKQRKLRLANQAAFFVHGKKSELLLGIDPEEYMQNWEVLHPDGTSYEPTELPLYRSLVLGEVISGEEAIIKIKGGEGHWISANAAPIKDSQGKILSAIVIFHDITEIKLILQGLEDQVDLRTKKLQKANRKLKRQKTAMENSLAELKAAQSQLIRSEKMASLGVLIAGVGHEINNPLNYVKGGLEGIQRLMDRKSESNGEILSMISLIEEGVTRTSRIVKSLSHISRQNTDFRERCSIHDIIENCLIVLHNTLKTKVTVVKEYHNEDLLIVGNEGKMHQLFMNLLTNAEQAIVDSGTITIRTFKKRGKAYISISDDGEGIPTRNLSKITDPFFTTKEPGLGTGLGLFIVHSILEEHGGNIQIESKPGEGSTFTIELPPEAPKNQESKIEDFNLKYN